MNMRTALRSGSSMRGMFDGWTGFNVAQAIFQPASLATPYIAAQTGQDVNVNDSPVFNSYVMPIANMIGNATPIGPIGTYLSATGNLQAGGMPLPGKFQPNPNAGIVAPNYSPYTSTPAPTPAPAPAPAPAPKPTDTNMPTAPGTRTRTRPGSRWPAYYRV